MNLITTREDHRHDFKEEWYGRNEKAEIARDILSFVNTTHHKDCYIFIGISDELEIVGVDPNDSNRKNQNDLSLRRKLHVNGVAMLSDSVGLGETVTAAAIIDQYILAGRM